MSEIKSTAPLAGENWAFELSKIVFPWKVMKLVVRPVLATFSIVGLVLGSGFSVSASQMALPGDALYGLKIASERVQVALTFDKKESAKIHVELAGKRINEIKKIKENTDSDQKKIQKINVAMDKFKEEISTVQNKLENLKNGSSAETTIEVAKIIDNKAAEYQEDLVKATDKLPELNDATQNINQSLDLAGQTGDAALAMIVEKHMQGEVLQPEDEVLERVENKIETTEAKAAEVRGQVSDLSLPVDPAATFVAQQTSDRAEVVLAEAREALDQKDLNIALTKAMEGKELVKQAEQIASDAIAAAAAVPEETEVVGCTDACGENAAETTPELTVTDENVTNTLTEVNNNKTNTNTVRVYAPVKVVIPPPPPVEPEIDESTLKVGIDLRQEPTVE